MQMFGVILPQNLQQHYFRNFEKHFVSMTFINQKLYATLFMRKLIPLILFKVIDNTH